jgi:hypothetical protein
MRLSKYVTNARNQDILPEIAGKVKLRAALTQNLREVVMRKTVWQMRLKKGEMRERS